MDSWALGVLLYTLVYGTMPFDGGDHKNLIRQISNGEYKEPTQSSGTAGTSVCISSVFFFLNHAGKTQLVPMAIIKLYYKLYLANVVQLDNGVSEVHHFFFLTCLGTTDGN